VSARDNEDVVVWVAVMIVVVGAYRVDDVDGIGAREEDDSVEAVGGGMGIVTVENVVAPETVFRVLLVVVLLAGDAMAVGPLLGVLVMVILDLVLLRLVLLEAVLLVVVILDVLLLRITLLEVALIDIVLLEVSTLPPPTSGKVIAFDNVLLIVLVEGLLPMLLTRLLRAVLLVLPVLVSGDVLL